MPDHPPLALLHHAKVERRAAQACRPCRARKSKCILLDSSSCAYCMHHNIRCDLDERSTKTASNGDDSSSRMVASAPSSYAESLHSSGQVAEVASAQHDRPAADFFSRLRQNLRLEPLQAGGQHDLKAGEGMFDNTLHEQCQLCIDLGRPHDLHCIERLGTIEDARAALPPKPIADFLLDVCARYATDLLFYCDQTELKERLQRFYHDDYIPTETDRSFLSFVFALLALSSQWTASVSRVTTHNVLKAERRHGTMFFQQACRLLPGPEASWDLESIQSSFVLSVYLLSMCALSALHSYCGFAMRKAVDQNLHLESQDPRLSALDREIRNRLWWSIYSLERSTALKLNRPRTLPGLTVTTAMPTPFKFLDERQLVNNTVHQSASTRLTKLTDAACEFSATQGDVFRNYDALAKRLKAWKRRLPAELRLDNHEPDKLGFRMGMHLHLNYYFIWIAISKSMLMQWIQYRMDIALGNASAALELERSTELRAASCVKAARKIIGIFTRLIGAGGLVKHSFTDFQGCSVATIVLLVAGIVERDVPYDPEVDFGMRCLAEMANDNPPATMGYNFVLKIQNMAHEATKQYRATPISTSPTTLPAEVANGVTDWLSWLSWHTTSADVEAEPRIAPTTGELSHTLLPHINEPPGYGTSHPAIGNVISESGGDDGFGQRPSQGVSCQEEEAAYFLFGDYASLMDLTGLEVLGLAGYS